jgi:hypothetical protein
MSPFLGEKVQQSFVGTVAQSLGWDASVLKSIAVIPDRLKEGFMDMHVKSPLLIA